MKKCLALLLAALLTLSLCLPVLAEQTVDTVIDSTVSETTVIRNGCFTDAILVQVPNGTPEDGLDLTLVLYLVGDSLTGVQVLDKESTGAEADVTASGSVFIIGDKAVGLDLQDDTVFTMTGEISVSATNDAIAVKLQDGSVLNLTGNILANANNAVGIYANGTDIAATVTDTISVMGAYSRAIDATNGSTVTVNGESISAGGNDSYGINALHSTVTAVGADITTTGDRANAINANSGAKVTAGGNEISTTGNSACGIYAVSSTVKAVNADVTTTGDNANAINAIKSTVILGGDEISTAGGSAYGIYANNSTVTAENANISTTGQGANAIAANSNANVTVGGESISTTGGSAHGISVANAAVTATNADISTTGNGAYAINATNDSTVIVGGESISTAGNSAYGIYASSSTITAANAGVTTTGDNANAINAIKSTVTLGGDVTTQGKESNAISVTYHSTVTVNGNAETSGENSIGAEVSGSGSIEVENISVNNGGTAVCFEKIDEDSAGTVVVNGEIFVGENSFIAGGDEEGLKNGNLYVYGITLTDETAGVAEDAALGEVFLNNANYIIHPLDEHVTLESGYDTDDELGLTYADAGLDDGKLTVSVENGYRIDTGADSRIQRENGQYVLHLNQADGNRYGYINFEVYNLICVGETEKAGGARWKVCKNENGIFTLVSVDTFTAEELANKEALLARFFNEYQMQNHVKSISDTPDQEYLDKYFGGEAGHLQITVDAYVF